MLAKIVSLIASFVFLFVSEAPLPAESICVVESKPKPNVNKTFDEIKGVGDTLFYIERPKAYALNEIDASQFGLSSENDDNYESFQKALDYCEANPNTKLNISKGVYRFKSEKNLILENAENIFIDGNGATFLFSETGYKFIIFKSECVEINNLICDWDRVEKPLASVVTVKNANPENHTLDIVFKNRENVSENMELKAITQCDPDTFTFGAKEASNEVYIYQDETAIESVKRIDVNTLRIKHNGCMDGFNNDEAYILRHFVYDGTIFQLNEYSKHITFDNVKIYGTPGMAYICEGNTSQFQLINSYIGFNPKSESDYYVSATADAIHIVNTDGFFNISNCDISKMGDDAINVHDGLGYVESVNGNKLTVIASAMRLREGDTLGFKNERFENTTETVKIKSIKVLEGIKKEITLDTDIADKIEKGYVAYSKECNSGNYVIKDNYFHENRARGLLLQSSNGLCENNRFYKTMAQSIKVVMDIVPESWQEGTGVDNLVIRNNTFEMCDYSRWGSIIEIGTNIAGEKAQTAVFTNIEISDNTFKDFPMYVFKISNVNGITIKDNTIDFGNEFSGHDRQGKIRFYEECENIIFANNTWADDGFGGTTKIIMTDNARNWAEINSQL